MELQPFAYIVLYVHILPHTDQSIRSSNKDIIDVLEKYISLYTSKVFDHINSVVMGGASAF